MVPGLTSKNWLAMSQLCVLLLMVLLHCTGRRRRGGGGGGGVRGTFRKTAVELYKGSINDCGLHSLVFYFYSS